MGSRRCIMATPALLVALDLRTTDLEVHFTACMMLAEASMYKVVIFVEPTYAKTMELEISTLTTPGTAGSINVEVFPLVPTEDAWAALRPLPDAILTVRCGDSAWLNGMPYWIRRRWVTLNDLPTLDTLPNLVSNIYWGYTNTDLDQETKISVFTPTYKATAFIEETWQALKAQTYRNWEWVVVVDGLSDRTAKMVREFCDPRIKVFEHPKTGRIGYLKRAATALCTGKILVELDHDDWLTPDCLQEVFNTFTENPNVGMVYSQFAEYYPLTNTCNEYDASYWTYKKTPWRRPDGQFVDVSEAIAYDVMGSFYDGHTVRPVIDAMNVCPNHVRAYRADVLSRIGGYRDLVWADDYDVMIRMFIHSEIKLIPKLLYVQRMGSNNTWTSNRTLLWPCFGQIKAQYDDALQDRYEELGLKPKPTAEA